MLDLEMRNFEDAFYDFRSRVKELDRRLSSLIIQGLDDCSGLANRFRLFDSFDLLLLRPIISEVRRHTNMVCGLLPRCTAHRSNNPSL